MEYMMCDTTHKSFKDLIACLDVELTQRYGEAQAAYQPHNIIERADAIVAMEGAEPAGCGCFRPYDENTVEIKRMYVKPEYRGKGIARDVLARLEIHAAKKGYQAVVLETGLGQPEAIRLYEKCGYQRIPGYGPYSELPGSVCFRKSLCQQD